MDTLFSLLPLVGGGLFGALMTMWNTALEDKRDTHKMTMQMLSGQHDRAMDTNKIATGNKRFALMRQIITIAILSILVGTFWLGGDINVPVSETTGNSYLFGIVDTTATNTVYKQLTGSVVLPEVLMSFQAIIGAYFGNSMVKR